MLSVTFLQIWPHSRHIPQSNKPLKSRMSFLYKHSLKISLPLTASSAWLKLAPVWFKWSPFQAALWNSGGWYRRAAHLSFYWPYALHTYHISTTLTSRMLFSHSQVFANPFRFSSLWNKNDGYSLFFIHVLSNVVPILPSCFDTFWSNFMMEEITADWTTKR